MKRILFITLLAIIATSVSAKELRPDCVTVVQKTANAGWGGEDSDFESISITSSRDSGSYMAGGGPVSIVEVKFTSGINKGIAFVDVTRGGCFVEKLTLDRL